MRKFYGGEVLFIDDGSTDGSREVLEDLEGKDEKVYLIRNAQREGYGASLIRGFSFSLDKGYDFVVTIDADGQHDPRHLPEFFGELMNFEVVLGSRYLNYKTDPSVPLDRYLINRYICSLLNHLFDTYLSDPFCGYRGYRASFLKEVKLEEKGYGLGLEIILEVIRLRSSFKEIAVELIYRDPARRFLDGLDDPRRRLLYYLDIIRKKRRQMRYGQEVLSYKPSSR